MSSPRASALGHARSCLTANPLLARHAARVSTATPSSLARRLLLDQSFLSGIGNWIADEVLYQARVHPESSASVLDAEAVRRLHAAIVSVLALAVKVEADHSQFPREWLFHFRWGKGKGKSVDAAGNAIEFVTVSRRRARRWCA